MRTRLCLGWHLFATACLTQISCKLLFSSLLSTQTHTCGRDVVQLMTVAAADGAKIAVHCHAGLGRTGCGNTPEGVTREGVPAQLSFHVGLLVFSEMFMSKSIVLMSFECHTIYDPQAFKTACHQPSRKAQGCHDTYAMWLGTSGRQCCVRC